MAQLAILVGQLAVFVMKLFCFYLGYRIVRIGADLLREGVTGSFTFKADLQGAKADLASASPGLLFLLLGVALIGYAMWIPKPVTIERERPPAVSQRSPPPQLSLPDDLSSAAPR